MIQTLEDIVRRFCAYGLEFKESNGFTHYCFTFIPALKMEYNISFHSSTGQTPAMLEKGLNQSLPADTLRKDFIDIHTTSSSFKIIFDKAKYEKESINDTF
ncbi:hypothetical protein O181_041150 [Austropuccinia psidii MF-1]|uniref:Uncharacterized protein n=1 Tax=Austropuccinia psidii MF-1 TaxID=1389203 RepID=A0A9Q3DED2_9BASI|nr:hypothetical protein [Austropuccinia psidii MF-1]